MNCLNDPKFFSENDESDTAIISLLTALHDFQLFYRSYHRHISLMLCLFGLLANTVHIWVLTRPRMLHSSVHTVLICIAFADIGTMSSYLIYLLRYEFGKTADGYSYGWVLFLKVHAALSIALHAVSLYLVVFLAYIRLRVITAHSSKWMLSHIAGLTSLSIAVTVFLLCIPTLLAHEIYAQRRERLMEETEGRSSPSSSSSSLSTSSVVNTSVGVQPVDVASHTTYSIGFSEIVLKNNCMLLKINLWLTGIMLKAVPCFLLFYLTIALLIKLKENKKKRKVLLGIKPGKGKDAAHKDSTTYMLLLMVCVFLATELPQGVMAILNAIFTRQFHLFVYLTLADVLDLLSLINCYVAFTVYFCTCSRYRKTLLTLIPPQILSLRWSTPVNRSIVNNCDEMNSGSNLKVKQLKVWKQSDVGKNEKTELVDISDSRLANGSADAAGDCFI